MDYIEVLSLKVEEVLIKFKKLNDENCRLKLEIEYLRKELLRNKQYMDEYIIRKRNINKAVIKLEKIIRKLKGERI
ncbi:MAG: hypothetical protein LBL53_01565 [Endomicrobium sp.]|jgi:regulator of replication initiation timing|nr:hypothetical protein [Endomicrobium sp.]